ncbi:hypothetical protein JHK87_034914 [Glycine soja]|nr:hypothetical protein JHK87_034914 [Glycine soja]
MPGCPADTETSPNDSCSLGEDDSSTEEDTSPSSGSDSNPQVGNGEASTPWINLFKDSRKPSKGFGLKFSPLSPEDPLEKAWGHSLIGYVAGRFPGKKALLECCQKWGVKFSYSTHESDWLAFKFDSGDDMNHVLSVGPNFIFQRPLLLKVMPSFFDFGNEELSKIPVWVKLRNLPLELWNPQALGKILALVEVDASLDLIEEVCFKLPIGQTFIQKIEYKNRPSFCTRCKMIGHRLAKCKVVSIVKQDNKTTTSEGPTTGSPSVQSQDAEVVAFTKTNPTNPFGKPKEDQIGLSTQPCMQQPQAYDNILALQTPFDISGVETSKSSLHQDSTKDPDSVRVRERSVSQNKKSCRGGSFSSKPMIIASWNIRGFNLPLKHHAMQKFLHNKGVNVMAILETKLNTISEENTLKRKFGDWNFSLNFASHNVGRILILWKFDKQAVPSFLHIRRFNSILSPNDCFNSIDISAYEMQDFAACCSEPGLGNLNSHGSMYTWTNGRVWSKLDRALYNKL